MGEHKIIITRESSLAGAAKTYKIEIDGFLVGKLGNGQSLEISTSEGPHTLSFTGFGKVEKSIKLFVQPQQYITKIYAQLNKWSGKIELQITDTTGCPITCCTNTSPIEQSKTSKRKKKHSVIATIGVLLGVLVFLGIIGTLSDNGENPSGSAVESQTSELSDEQKAENSLKLASDKFADGKYMDAIEVCGEITALYPETTIAANMQKYLSDQYSLFPHFSAKDLMHEYDANIVNADKEYSDTVMIVSGTISSIGKTNNDKNLCVILNSDTYFYGVQLNFNQDQADNVAALSKGQKISAIGKCTGRSGKQFLIVDGKNVMIEDCYIVE